MFPDVFLTLSRPWYNFLYRRGNLEASAFPYHRLVKPRRLPVLLARKRCYLNCLSLQEAQILPFVCSAPSREGKHGAHLPCFEISASPGSFCLFLWHWIQKYTPCLS